MSDRSTIEWTEATWNPVTGCDRVSAGCDHCYALALAGRLKAMGSAKYQRDGDQRTSGPGFGVTLHPGELATPRRWRRPRLVFVNSMSDLFHPQVPERFIAEVFAVMAASPQHTYQVLTKRPQRARSVLRRLNVPPLSNVWAGVSVENAATLDRVRMLRETPATVRFLSCEPLLGPLPVLDLVGIDWVIVGGESGPQARPMHEEWVTEIRDICRDAGIPFFFKQWGGRTPKAGGRRLEGRTWDGMPRGWRQPMAKRAPRSWGYWTEGKLDILAKYLDAFTTATKKVDARIYLDAFAGQGRGVSRTTQAEFEGSARIGLNVSNPPFDRCYFFELQPRAAELQQELTRDFPGRFIRVVPGDCNATIPAVLAELRRHRLDWAPTFAFLDPDGTELCWETIEALANHKQRRAAAGRPLTKVELWLLFPSQGLIRTLALDEARLLPSHRERATRLFGCDAWERIYWARKAGHIEGQEARERYVNLYRWQLERHLGYRRTHPIEVKNQRDRTMYHLIFASDSEPGDKIMSHLYAQALRQRPKMMEEARRRAGRAEQLPLFVDDEADATFAAKAYAYEPPIDPSAI